MSGQAEIRSPHAQHTAARVGGLLLLTGGSLAIILMWIGPGFVHGKIGTTLGVASVAIVVGLFCVIWPTRVPGWVLPLIGPLGTVLIALSSILTGTATDGSELLYMWTVLFSAYFVAWRYALINVGLIAVVYPPIAISVLGRPGITPSVYLVGTSVVTLVIVGHLRRRLTDVITATAREARTDTLTGLANRRSWEEGMARELGRQHRTGNPLCVLVVDLDLFKNLNDTYGHATGDVALVGVATLLRGLARQSDVLARVGGEEFALLLPDCSADDALLRAEEIRIAVEQTASNWATPVTVSIGAATLPAHARTGEELMQAADVALYEAKRAGRNRVRMYTVEGPPPVDSTPASTRVEPGR
jgi:diguanylate cyclase (GGDEF)-like protein